MSKQKNNGYPMYSGHIWGTLPTDFPTGIAEAVYRRLIDEMSADLRARRLIGCAFKGVAYRFKEMVRHGQEYEESRIANGLTPPVDIEFEQEHSLFSFFISGMSALECFFFALYFVGAHHAPSHFNLKLCDITPRKVTSLFKAVWPNEPITMAALSLVDSEEFKRWTLVRNTTIHRAVPPRAITIQPGHPTEVIWKIEEKNIQNGNQILNEATVVWREWISRQLQILLSALVAFPLKAE